MDTQGSVYRLWTFSRIITEPPFIILTDGRVGLMHQIANLAYMRVHVMWGRSLSCTLLLR